MPCPLFFINLFKSNEYILFDEPSLCWLFDRRYFRQKRISKKYFIILAKIVDFLYKICYIIGANLEKQCMLGIHVCGSGSVVERCLAKANVAGSSPVFRSKMVPSPSGKAKVCKTFIPRFKSGWYLQNTGQRFLK